MCPLTHSIAATKHPLCFILSFGFAYLAYQYQSTYNKEKRLKQLLAHLNATFALKSVIVGIFLSPLFPTRHNNRILSGYFTFLRPRDSVIPSLLPFTLSYLQFRKTQHSLCVLCVVCCVSFPKLLHSHTIPTIPFLMAFRQILPTTFFSFLH
ncbi:hypothetical protein VNO77_24367 [Canavalia gladiata]|uniref:Uncharacterized protein n=1 Tax=Canavalia gladiata TaxID=3824 RepID=A0AAN9L657_CANGL